jgi:RNA polymerase sigma factor (sigma-70 family)
VGAALGEWQAGEVRYARRLPQCRGLDTAQLEDLYQETMLALLHLPYNSEEHLRNALRFGLKNRARHLYRDERRREEILADLAPEMHLSAVAREEQSSPEPTLLARQDQLVVREFMTELTPLEKKVFALEAENMRYRAIAPILGVSVNDARNASRSCERKRKRFQLLHDTGRLCGYRSHTIAALKAGQSTSEALMRGAYAHLDACSHCRAEHKTNARRLRRSFQEKAAALLPIPALAGHLGWLARLEHRARMLHHRLSPYGSPPTAGGVRERAVAMLASGGAAAKLAAGVATVAVIAGGAIGARSALQHPRAHPQRRLASPAVASARPSSPPAMASRLGGEQGPHDSGAEARAQPQTQPVGHAASGRREPGGFAYLGVPSASASHASGPARAASAGTGAGAGSASGEEQRGGGPFSP